MNTVDVKEASRTIICDIYRFCMVKTLFLFSYQFHSVAICRFRRRLAKGWQRFQTSVGLALGDTFLAMRPIGNQNGQKSRLHGILHVKIRQSTI